MTMPPSQTTSDLVVADVRDVVVIRLNRPEKLNALTQEMLRGLAANLRSVGSSDARGIVLTGTGRAFSAGEDLDAVDTEQESLNDIDLFQDITYAVLESEVPVVAALNGIAVGGAAEMTLVCDSRLGAAECEYFFPENGLGLTISNGSSRLLPQLIGSRAMRVVLDARRLDAPAALELGILDEVLPPGEDVVEAAVELVRHWTEPGRSTREHLKLLRPSKAELDDALERERHAARAAWERGATAAGVVAFRERPRDADD
jgi:enoyl-CoA hydratase/carnithine racemase